MADKRMNLYEGRNESLSIGVPRAMAICEALEILTG
jgi:hypothetical protein